jgi:hypothetical protein
MLPKILKWKFLMFRINLGPPPASPKFQKAEFGGEKLRFSPPFSLFENREIQRGSISPPKTTSANKKYFIFVFQVLKNRCDASLL